MTDRKKSRTPAREPAAAPPPSEPREKKSKRARETPSAPTPVVPAPPVIPAPTSPEDAAFAAASAVAEVIDIDTPTGAIIAAAAAAGAAIEVKRATDPSTESADTLSTTGRLSRDSILAAIAAEEAAATPTPDPDAKPAPVIPRRAATEPGIPTSEAVPVRVIPRAGSEPAPEPPRDDVAESPVDQAAANTDEPEEFDPVQIAAAAIQRLRKRAKTDLAELRGHYNRHDGLVILLAFIIIVVAARIHAGLVTPPNVTFRQRGLTFEHSQAWLTPEPIEFTPSRLLHEPIAAAKAPVDPDATGKDKDKAPYHVEFTSTLDPAARIEVLIDALPAWSNLISGRELERQLRWGELYKLETWSVVDVEGNDWLRTEFTFAHAPTKGDAPRVDHALEYATFDKTQLYVITMFGSPKELAKIEGVVAPTLHVPTNVGLGLDVLPKLSRANYPRQVGVAFESTVMVIVADLVDGHVRVNGGGSGVIVGGDGSILTAYHVIHDHNGRLHDVFIVGRFAKPDQPPVLECVGRPNRSKLQRDVDLALIKCDTDLDGRAWSPTSAAGVWQTLPEGRSTDVAMGQRLWVLGYPDKGGGGLTLAQGQVEGWTGIDGAQGRDYIKTHASIRSGNSGGPVVDDNGKLVGIAAAFRTKVTVTEVTETTQIGLVRPLSAASDLLAIAAAGWTPREGRTDVDLAPAAVEAPAEGAHLSTTVLDAANEAPIAEALVMVLRKGVSSSDIDVNKLDDQVLSWGRTNSHGEVLLKQPVPVPGTYSVMVVARGYEQLIGKDALVLGADTPPSFDPWGKIWLRSR